MDLLPLLERNVTPDLDDHAYAPSADMTRRYAEPIARRARPRARS